MPQVRQSVPRPKMICFDCFSWPSLDLLVISQRLWSGFARLIRPTYAEANVGHPSYSHWVLLGRRLRQDSILNRRFSILFQELTTKVGP